MTSYDIMARVRSANPNDVSQRHPLYLKHQHQVEMVKNVYEGVDTMKQYLFQFPQEILTTYNDRADRATLRNFVKRAVEAFTGMVFRKPVEVTGYGARTTRSFPKIDTKKSIEQFSRETHDAVTRDSIAYLLADAPSEPSEGDAPYLTLIERSSLINWRRDSNGKFTMVVIEEMVTEPNGDFGVTYIQQWRHYDNEGLVTVYRRTTKKTSSSTTDFFIYSQVQMDYIGIPLIEINISNIPILYDIAKMNIKHYNRQSHKDRYLTMAALPIPLVWGADINDDGTPSTTKPALVIGVDEAFIFTGTKDECDFQWRELSGDSIKQLEDDLNSITEDITTGILRAAETANSVQKTATEVSLLQAEASNRSQTIADAVEAGMRDALVILSEFNQETVPENATFKLSNDFNAAMMGSDGIRLVFESYLMGLVSIETYLQALSDAELIPMESVSVELEKIQKDTFKPVPPVKVEGAGDAKTDNRTKAAMNKGKEVDSE